MITEFYIVNKSFEYNINISKEILENRIKDLSEDYEYIKRYPTEKIFVHHTIYEQAIFEDITVSEFLEFTPKVKEKFNKQVVSFLNIIIRKSKSTSYTVDEVVDVLLNEQSKENLFGLICLHRIEGIDDKYLVYNKHNWLDFHRHFLSYFSYDRNESELYINECVKYFPNLFFHKGISASIELIIESFSKSVIRHLICLNDVFYTKYKGKKFKNESEKYQLFTSECKLDGKAASKDTNERKEKLAFYFQNDNGQEMEIICYPHLRLCKSDIIGDSHYYDNRLYFHEGLPEIQMNRILIAHIGNHL